MANKYREALEWTGGNHRPMYDFLTNGIGKDASMTTVGDNFVLQFSKVEGGLVIKTLEGNRNATIGNYIIKGIKGDFHPCNPDIFAATYEKV